MISLTTIMIAKEIDLTKSTGTNQEVIINLSPSPEDDTVKRAVNIKITFDKKLQQKTIKKSIKLTYLGCEQEKKAILQQRKDKNIQKCKQRYQNKKHLKKECIQCAREVYRYQKKRNCKKRDIKGKVKYVKKRDILLFNPHKKLRPGYYQVTVKGLKTQDNTKIKNISYRFEVSKNNIESITLLQEEIKLEIGESTTLKLQAIYHDNATEDITKDINWIVGDSTIISIDTNGTVKALKPGETLLQAEYHGKVSKEITVTVANKPEIINGYILPPEPDETLNNSTMLGIDSNDNGVRDDVERYIVKRFQGFENALVDRGVALQYAKATQTIIQNPEMAYVHNIYEIMDNAMACEWYYYDTHLENIKGFRNRELYRQKHKIFDTELKDEVFNTRERLEAYLKYNDSLSGHMYPSLPHTKEKCDFEVDALLGGGK